MVMPGLTHVFSSVIASDSDLFVNELQRRASTQKRMARICAVFAGLSSYAPVAGWSQFQWSSPHPAIACAHTQAHTHTHTRARARTRTRTYLSDILTSIFLPSDLYTGVVSTLAHSNHYDIPTLIKLFPSHAVLHLYCKCKVMKERPGSGAV